MSARPERFRQAPRTVANFHIMANESKQGAGRWSGDEVERQPADEAEAAAARAQGNAPIPAGSEEPDVLEAQPEGARRRAPSKESPEDKRADTAATHGEDEAARHRPGHGKL
jgi:hypothetical protein